MQHEVREFVDQADDPGECRATRGDTRRVELIEVAHARVGHLGVASLHLRDEIPERARGRAGVLDHGCEQMRNDAYG